LEELVDTGTSNEIKAKAFKLREKHVFGVAMLEIVNSNANSSKSVGSVGWVRWDAPSANESRPSSRMEGEARFLSYSITDIKSYRVIFVLQESVTFRNRFF
jgi:hypothetical protein